MEQIALINPENVSEADAVEFKIREAARAVVFDDENYVALLYASQYGYYKLPGGGIEKDEDPEIALKRECAEEIGCNIKIERKLGVVLEYRKRYGLKQTSHCYIAKLIGIKGRPTLMEDEIEEGFQTIWMPIEEAIKKVQNGRRDKYETQYMIPRDLAFLEATI